MINKINSAKYVAAKLLLPDYRHEKKEELYLKLESLGYYWVYKIGKWVQSDSTESEISILIAFNGELGKFVNDEVINFIVEGMDAIGYNYRVRQTEFSSFNCTFIHSTFNKSEPTETQD